MGSHLKSAGVGRSGLSFTGLGPQRFNSRRMIWACFDDAAAPIAMEMRAVSGDDEEQRSGRILRARRMDAVRGRSSRGRRALGVAAPLPAYPRNSRPSSTSSCAGRRGREFHSTLASRTRWHPNLHCARICEFQIGRRGRRGNVRDARAAPRCCRIPPATMMRKTKRRFGALALPRCCGDGCF